MTNTAQEIKHIENSFEVLNEFGIEIDLEGIIIEEFKLGLQYGLEPGH